jgi:hypothetical protein
VRKLTKRDTMNEQQQRDAVVSMQADMRHLLRAVDDIKATMATKGELALLATKAEMTALVNRVDQLEREVRDKSPGALWKTLTGWASGLVVIVAAAALVIKWVKGLP